MWSIISINFICRHRVQNEQQTIKTQIQQISIKRHLYQNVHICDWYLTALIPGLVSSMILEFWESFRRPINLYIKCLKSAWKVLTPAWQNSSLALLHLGFLSKILIQSLYATWSLWRLAFLYLTHRGAVYRGVQYALKRLILTSTEQKWNFLSNMFACYLGHTYLNTQFGQ